MGLRIIWLTIVTLAFGCGKSAEIEQPPGVWSDAQARTELTRFLNAYVSGSADDAVALLCDRDSGARAAAAQFIQRSQREGSPFRVGSFAIGELKAAWKESKPIFDAKVRFKTERQVKGENVEITQRFFIKADPGCIDGMGQSIGKHGSAPQPAQVGPSKEPSKSPPEVETLPDAPVGAEDEVIEL